MNLYADNTALYAFDEDPGTVGSELEQDLQRVANWISTDGLRMNFLRLS